MADIINKLKAKFTSGNTIPVTSTRISINEYKQIVQLIEAMQAKIDSLMIEFTPEDMTKIQLREFALSQKALKPQFAKTLYENLDDLYS